MTAPTFTPVRCGNRKAHGRDSKVFHNSADEVRRCFTGELEDDDRDWDDGAAWAEAAYERHLEDRGYESARAQDEHEARNGVISFRDAWYLASPETAPYDH